MFDSYSIREVDGYFYVRAGTTTGWVHGVMVYHGVGQGITVYQDGRKIETDAVKTVEASRPTGSGNLVIGKRNPHGVDRYATASVDEIKMYNRQLTQQEFCEMY